MLAPHALHRSNSTNIVYLLALAKLGRSLTVSGLPNESRPVAIFLSLGFTSGLMLAFIFGSCDPNATRSQPSDLESLPTGSYEDRIHANFKANDTHPSQNNNISLNDAVIKSATFNSKHHCLWKDGCDKSFKRISDLERHWQSVHLLERYHCIFNGCDDNGGQGFSRRDKLTEHERKKHGKF